MFRPVVCIVVGALAWPALAQTIHGQGRAVVASGVERARAQAVDRALRAAVAGAVSELGGPAEGADAKTDREVYDRAAAFVTSRVATGESVEGRVLSVGVDAEVDREALRRVLGARAGPAGARPKPVTAGTKVMVLVSEQIGPARFLVWSDVLWSPSEVSSRTKVMHFEDSSGGVQAVVANAFALAGFTTVDVEVLRGKLTPTPMNRLLSLDANDASDIAQKGDADLVVVVKAAATSKSRGELASAGMVSGQANLTAKLIRVTDAKVLATAVVHHAAVHVDSDTACITALNEGAQEVAQTLLRGLNAENH